MSRQGKAFTAAFLNQLTQGIKDRGAIGLAFEEKEMDRFDINKQDFKKRLLDVETAKNLATKLRKLGARNRHIMYYAKDGDPITALKEIEQKLRGIKEQKLTSRNPEELTPEMVDEILDLPAEFKDDAMPMEEFWNRTFNLFKENEKAMPSDNDEAFMGNLIFAALNLNPKERVRRKLENTMYKGDYSIKDINDIAMKSRYADAFGGEFEAAEMDVTKFPVTISSTDRARYEKLYTDTIDDLLKNEAEIVKAFGNLINPKLPSDRELVMGGIRNQMMEERFKSLGFGGDMYQIAKAYAEARARQKVIDVFELGKPEIDRLPFLQGTTVSVTTGNVTGGNNRTGDNTNNKNKDQDEPKLPFKDDKKLEKGLAVFAERVEQSGSRAIYDFIQTFGELHKVKYGQKLPDGPPMPEDKDERRKWKQSWGKYYYESGKPKVR
tara:strand:- start:471 stop:1781 length:1311 start_codon:yes stop_codon:yes gene_type:complete